MRNTASWDPIHTTNYVGEYLDLVHSLPYELQRNVSLMREMDSKYQELLKELDEAYEKHGQEEDPIQRRRLLHFIQRALIQSQELGDDKIQLASQMVEMLENRSRQVDNLAELLEARHEHHESVIATTTSSIIPSKRREEEKQREESLGSIDGLSGTNKRSRRQKNYNSDTLENIAIVHHDEGISGGTAKEKRMKTSKKKKRSKADREPSPTDLPIDPNEHTYCLCEQVSFGEMIGCDNDECPIEWFHFSCVGLNHKPKGKWYCPKCRGDTEKTMDKALEKSKKEKPCNR